MQSFEFQDPEIQKSELPMKRKKLKNDAFPAVRNNQPPLSDHWGRDPPIPAKKRRFSLGMIWKWRIYFLCFPYLRNEDFPNYFGKYTMPPRDEDLVDPCRVRFEALGRGPPVAS